MPTKNRMCRYMNEKLMTVMNDHFVVVYFTIPSRNNFVHHDYIRAEEIDIESTTTSV
jgi:hypothetical protein